MLSCIFDQKRSNLLWYCLLRCKMWFSLSNLCVTSYAVTIQMKAISGSFLWLYLCNVFLASNRLLVSAEERKNRASSENSERAKNGVKREDSVSSQLPRGFRGTFRSAFPTISETGTHLSFST